MVQVDDDVVHAVSREPADDAARHRLAGNRDGRLGADRGERAEPRPKSGGQDHRMREL
jgi:hypothetical protein